MWKQLHQGQASYVNKLNFIFVLGSDSHVRML
uniref:Uncharacterized protein n=1 Tax=Arundo donax TaxID=35708 RepID=A0A0A8YZQ0_ARUDO